MNDIIGATAATIAAAATAASATATATIIVIVPGDSCANSNEIFTPMTPPVQPH